jgi:L-ribulose-5-phosphate 3-epimerase
MRAVRSICWPSLSLSTDCNIELGADALHHPDYTRPFGIVQGRLTVSPPGQLQWFPQDNWQDEFHAAEQANIAFIELLTERDFNPDNPVWSETGRRELRSLSQSTGRELYSICADYIIDHALLDDPEGETSKHMDNFFDAGLDLGCKIAVLPLLEHSDLNQETLKSFVPVIQTMADRIAGTDMIICIESLLNGEALKSFLEAVAKPNVKCVFDTGNRVISNTDLAPEIQVLGDWISHVHIKDKNAKGENVLLGTGLVRFDEVFQALRALNYSGPLVFETTRGTDPVSTAKFHMELCNFFAHEAWNA